jgi:stage V sporulation protein R
VQDTMSLLNTPYDTSLTPELRAVQQEIEGYAREFGLDFFEVIFELLDADDLNAIAAYGGFPTRYPHWSFGMAYEELKKTYDYGLAKIYELVINNDPCYAYLMRSNNLVDQKLVMAHVYGHCDFFKNNAFFAHTNRKMMDEMANHGMRIRRYAEKYGEDEVEAFLDKCKSIEDLIDIHSVAIRRREEQPRFDFEATREEEPIPVTRFKTKTYLDPYINPNNSCEPRKSKNARSGKQGLRIFQSNPSVMYYCS